MAKQVKEIMEKMYRYTDSCLVFTWKNNCMVGWLIFLQFRVSHSYRFSSFWPNFTIPSLTLHSFICNLLLQSCSFFPPDAKEKPMKELGYFPEGSLTAKSDNFRGKRQRVAKMDKPKISLHPSDNTYLHQMPAEFISWYSYYCTTILTA